MLPANFDHVYATGETLTLPVGSLHVPGFKIDENASTLDFGNESVYTYAQVLTQGYTDIDQAYQEFNSVTVPDGGDYADSTALFTTVLVPQAASVTVNYIVAGTNTPLATTLTSACGYTVDLPACSFDGYTLLPISRQPTTSPLQGKNTITIAYTPVTTPTPEPDLTSALTSTSSTTTKTAAAVVGSAAKQDKLPDTGD